ncbi:Zps1p [Sporobolomyces koalae]|uniref:Zps1p n=1 Tax=Sporobolomyces koalae TaxID=500713 RepID=UPI00317852BA
MLSSNLVATLLTSFVVSATTVQAAPFFTLSKRADSSDQTAESIDKHSHTNSTQVQIHESCDAGQARFIRAGLDDMNMIAQHAHDRILKYGPTDELYIKYFGNASALAAAGYYDQLVNGNKPGVLFRCDNPDGNCDQVTEEGPWAGHWRGKNATEQTVICPPTYTRRMQLSTLCWDGVEIGSVPPTRWLATDFMHRLTHVPSISYDLIHHVANTLGGVMELAASNDSSTITNQDTFQFYALDAYAYDVVWPGKSCVTKNPPQEESESGHGTASATLTTTSAEPTATESHDHDHDHAGGETATATTSAAESCHTHSDGEIHCV